MLKNSSLNRSVWRLPIFPTSADTVFVAPKAFTICCCGKMSSNTVQPNSLLSSNLMLSEDPQEKEISTLMRCITAIPICGGFCAETKNPEPGILRHFSNETTPPQPCLSRYMCRRFWEHPPWCRFIGTIGCEFGERNRGRIMTSAFIVSFIAWILTFAAFGATSSHASVIKNTCWAESRVVFSSEAAASAPAGVTVLSYVGINDRVDVIKPIGQASNSSTTPWSSTTSCGIALEYGLGLKFPGCEKCAATAQQAMTWLISAAVTQIFQMTTDLQRTTRFGDLNCQKSLGTITGIYGTFATLQSLREFMKDCTGRGNFDYFAKKVEVITVENATFPGSRGTVSWERNGGPGFMLLCEATILVDSSDTAALLVAVAVAVAVAVVGQIRMYELALQLGCC